MTDFICLAADSDETGSVEITSNIGDDPHIVLVLRELKRYLRAIGYDWVEVVEVSATLDDGETYTHSSEDDVPMMN